MRLCIAAALAVALAFNGRAWAAPDKAEAQEEAPPPPAAPPALAVEPAPPVVEPAPEYDKPADPSRATVTPAARAGELLQMFQTFCRDTHVGKTQILAAAEREGFAPASADEVKTLAGFSFENLELRAKTVGGVRLLVAAGRGRHANLAGQPNLDFCIVGVSPIEAGAAGSFSHWAGVEPVSHSLTGGDMFMFVEGPEGRRSVASTDVSEMRRHVRDGDMQLLLVGDQDGSTLAIYGVIRPEI
jgi:hypothetical protein